MPEGQDPRRWGLAVQRRVDSRCAGYHVPTCGDARPSTVCGGPSMARFLFITWDGGGTIPPGFGIAQALRERGHEVVFAGQELMPATDAASTGRGFLEARAAAHGFRFARLERSSAAWLKESPEHRIVT